MENIVSSGVITPCERIFSCEKDYEEDKCHSLAIRNSLKLTRTIIEAYEILQSALLCSHGNRRKIFVTFLRDNGATCIIFNMGIHSFSFSMHKTITLFL